MTESMLAYTDPRTHVHLALGGYNLQFQGLRFYSEFMGFPSTLQLLESRGFLCCCSLACCRFFKDFAQFFLDRRCF